MSRSWQPDAVYIIRELSGVTQLILGQQIGRPGKTGTVFAVDDDLGIAARTYAVKIFHGTTPPDDLQQRIDAANHRRLYAFAPSRNSLATYPPVAGPTAIVYRTEACDQPVGVLILLVDPSRFMSFSNFVESSRAADLGLMVRASIDLASVVEHIHSLDFIIGDMSGANILMDSDGCCSIIDVDSFGIRDRASRENVLAPTAASHNYSAPELMNSPATESTDCFVLSTLILYMILRGAHPYGGVYELADQDSWQANINARTSWLIEPANFILPAPHTNHPGLSSIPLSLELLAVDALMGPPDTRPGADRWLEELYSLQDMIVQCPVCREDRFRHCACAACGSGKRRPAPVVPELPPLRAASPEISLTNETTRRRSTVYILTTIAAVFMLLVLILVIVNTAGSTSHATSPILHTPSSAPYSTSPIAPTPSQPASTTPLHKSIDDASVGDCLTYTDDDSAQTADVGCDTRAADFKIVGIIDTQNPGNNTKGSCKNDRLIDGNGSRTFCVNRVYRPGQCSWGVKSSKGIEIYYGTVVACGAKPMGSYTSVLRIVEVSRSPSVDCGSYSRYDVSTYVHLCAGPE